MYVNPSVRNHVYIYSEFVKITDGNGTGLLYHPGCVTYSVEVLAHVTFGLSNNISIQAYAERPATTIMIKFAILKKGLESGMINNKLSKCCHTFATTACVYLSICYIYDCH